MTGLAVTRDDPESCQDNLQQPRRQRRSLLPCGQDQRNPALLRFVTISLCDPINGNPAQQSEISCVKKKWINGAPFPWWRPSRVQIRDYSDHCCWEANPTTPLLTKRTGSRTPERFRLLNQARWYPAGKMSKHWAPTGGGGGSGAK